MIIVTLSKHNKQRYYPILVIALLDVIRLHRYVRMLKAKQLGSIPPRDTAESNILINCVNHKNKLHTSRKEKPERGKENYK